MSKNTLHPEVRAYFQEIGRKRGNALKEKYGEDYFKRISAMRKTFGAKPGKRHPNSAAQLAEKYGISRQRLYQILDLNGEKFNQTDYPDIGEWRVAVISDYYADKTVAGISKLRSNNL